MRGVLAGVTARDLRIAGLVSALVVVAFFAIGYAVGELTSPKRITATSPSLDYEPVREQAEEPDFLGRTQARVPGWQDLYVNDYEDLISPEGEAAIRADLEELWQRTGIEMTLLTIPSTSTYGHPGPIEPFATELFNDWGIGDADRDDGVLILISRWDRAMRIEIGDGYAPEWDAVMQRVIDRAFLPAFREDRYEDGIRDGVEETIFAVAGSYPGDYERPTWEQGWSWIGRRLGDLGLWLLGLLAVPVAGAAFAVRSYLRNRPRPCERCGTIMQRAGEEADDAHLDGGQRLEEYLKSVDYDVWHCPSQTCGSMKIIRYPSWTSSHSACPQCGYRTLSTTSTVLKEATRTSTGTKRLDYECRNCGHTDSEIRTIPKVSDSSSGSSRSSFGGGSSSGGGASGRW
jgi:uncharacterized protein